MQKNFKKKKKKKKDKIKLDSTV